jgi:hypothetical protein
MAADEVEPSARFLPRWVLYVAIPGLVLPLLILVFIFVSELAHDESRCAYARASEQTLADGTVVREEMRRCLPGMEEHRYSALRSGSERVLGRRRFARSAFDPIHYSWKAELSEQGEVRVSVRNQGHADAVFREGTEQERAE